MTRECGCSTRAYKLLTWLGWKTIAGRLHSPKDTEQWVMIRDLKDRHFKLTIIAIVVMVLPRFRKTGRIEVR